MASPGRDRGSSIFDFSTREIVISGIIGGVALFLGATRLGLIPVPIPFVGNATLLHIPAVLGGALEGPVVGLLAGAIFGAFSFLYAEVPLFRDPIVAFVPRLLIGVVAWMVFASLRRWNIDFASVAAGLAGSLTNSIGVLGLGLILPIGPEAYLPVEAVVASLPQVIIEAILAAIVTVVVVRGVLLVRSGRTTASETGSDEERRY
ncbi:ECF transporter S component [Rubrobacter tropicus]|uniref:ECF transporter S component n=1 Tax=Rubrobacter tropicus TaxID=2653851 RepID=UPI001D1848D4|nr:ECF transporter S component [Rubrobacter tropicus]